MKTAFAGVAATALALSASAAVVNYSWSAGGINIVGTFTTDINSGNATEANVTAATATITGGFTYNGAVTVLGASWDLSTGALGSGSTFAIGDDTLGVWVLAGSQGGSDWSFTDQADPFNPLVENSSIEVSISPAVPEPEAYAAVAGAGLVAFGLFRRRSAKA